MRRKPGELLATEIEILHALARAARENRPVWSWVIWEEVRATVDVQTNSGVYRALERLRDMKLVESEWEGGHRYWRLTDGGRAEVAKYTLPTATYQTRVFTGDGRRVQ